MKKVNCAGKTFGVTLGSTAGVVVSGLIEEGLQRNGRMATTGGRVLGKVLCAAGAGITVAAFACNAGMVFLGGAASGAAAGLVFRIFNGGQSHGKDEK